METGFDALLDFLLSEIAVCGTQGANSADFHRFIHKFYQTGNTSGASEGSRLSRGLPQAGLGRAFYEKLWKWVTTHSDIRIIHNGEVAQYSLADFEQAEHSNGTSQLAEGDTKTVTPTFPQTIQLAKSSLAFGTALRERLAAEEHGTKLLKYASPELRSLKDGVGNKVEYQSIAHQHNVVRRTSRIMPNSHVVETAVFDEPTSTASTPRLYASQNRIWQALTGHSMDLKKVPTMEFALLSLIAANGANGITQPDLTHFSGQDKRSVPHRTDELARKGYIVKNPVQAGKIRTSLCVHTKFVSHDHFISSGAVDDVFQVGTFVASGFMQLLYNEFKDAGVVPTREIRKRLGVPMRTWNKRAVQGALIRLDQSGMIRRFRVRKRKAEESWVICIQIQREPRAEDLENLGFRRQVAAIDPADDLLQDDIDGDTLMKDLEADMLDDGDETEANNNLESDGRIPPQWTPDRLLGNVILEATALGQAAGWDALVLRDRIMGPFWRRPMESYLTRLTEDWERTQPPHLRHLAIIRDTRNTEEKKFLHYVYRTYRYFQEAVGAGEAIWEGVSRATKPIGKANSKKHVTEDPALSSWGFRSPNQKDFVRLSGAATLSEVRSAIVNPRKYGPRWDNALAEEIGYHKLDMPVPKLKVQPYPGSSSADTSALMVDDEDQEEDSVNPFMTSKSKSNQAKNRGLNLTPEQRLALGLKPSGRLSKNAAKQILAHRRATGDPTSLPDKVVEETAPRGRAPLMTREERLAENLPLKGRLGLEKENEIREKRGLPKLMEKDKKKKKRISKEVAILTKQQRVNLGFKSHGRLHQHFVDALRREQEDDIPLDKSPAVEAYREFLKNETAKSNSQKDTTTFPNQTSSPDVLVQHVDGELEQNPTPETGNTGAGLPTTMTTRKRKVTDAAAHLSASKKHRILPNPLLQKAVSSIPALFAPEDGANALLLASLDQSGENVRTTFEGPSSAGQSEQRSGESTVSEHDTNLASKPPSLDRTDVNVHEDIVRSSPGIYIYPFAKRKVARGRPRNACIAVFRLSSLCKLPWFTIDPGSGYESSLITSMGSCRSVPEGVRDQVAATADADPAIDVHTTHMPTESSNLGVISDTGTGAVSSHIEHLVSTGNDIEVSHVQIQPECTTNTQSAVSEQDSGNTERQARSEAADDQLFETGSETQEALTVTTPMQNVLVPKDATTGDQPTPCAVTASTVTNALTQVTQPAYQSPYAFSNDFTSVISAEQAPAFDNTNVPTPRLDNPISEADNVMKKSQGVSCTIPEIQDAGAVVPKKPSARSAGPGITGSALKFRREIIQEIIDRCGGVFPLHGEIWRPFSAMWDQRHGHTSISKPQSSTVSDTLKNMISNPAFKLKRMTFAVKARNAKGVKEKVIVTKSDMTSDHARVRTLAYNMANHALEKSSQFYPEEIRDVFEYETMYVPVPIAPKDETITLDQFYPELEISIKENRDRRRREKAAQKKAEKEAAKKQNEQVEQAFPKRRAHAETQLQIRAQNVPRAKRTRLASLNDKNKRYRRAPAHVPALDDVEEVFKEDDVREPSPVDTDSSEDVALITLRPGLVGGIVDRGTNKEERSSLHIGESNNEPSKTATGYALDAEMVSLTYPAVGFHSSTGTFSTFFSLITRVEGFSSPLTDGLMSKSTKSTRVIKKRVRIDDSASELSSKKARTSRMSQQQILDEEFVYSSSDDSDATSSEDEDEDDQIRSKPTQKRRKRSKSKRQVGKKTSVPTLLERLTGLTGDPNDPIYKDPKQRQRLGAGSVKPWVERKKRQLNKLRKERQYTESLDEADRFKKLCLTLVVASSMSGEHSAVNWTIVEKVYARDAFFDLLKTKKLWKWMQASMAKQLSELTHAFQTNFLGAYEAGRLPSIDDPNTYDWAGLLRWTMRTCIYPEFPLPLYREAIRRFVVDESGYAKLNRNNWYGKKIADTTRTHLQLQLSFVAPLHRSCAQMAPTENNEIKARSWIRANTATPQYMYNANRAHEKLKVIGEDILARVVADFVQQEQLKMRKLKRQLPGRNYTFTNKFARSYKRPFELDDFLVAVTVKKELDTAFAHADPDKRYYSISRCEEDGAVMAIMSLVGDGKVELVPMLPTVDNGFGAPLPRLSKWGFCEGDYIHRAIDRNRLFWDTYVVPTSKYEYGNPLQPLPSPNPDWPSLPEPPLPGKLDSGAMIPIWSSIDGQSVTWPWWYRILNLVLQPLYLQPGASAMDIFLHCPEHTTELFEVELVLGWLSSISAVSKTADRGYEANPNFWAAFGDKLLDTEDDWFGEHVKRKFKMTAKRQWRDKYNLRYSALQTRSTRPSDADDRMQEQRGTHMHGPDYAMSQQIIRNSKAQYRILQQAMLEPTSVVQETTTESQSSMQATAQNTQTVTLDDQSEQTYTTTTFARALPENTPAKYEQVNMPHAIDRIEDADAEGGPADAEEGVDDMDAEGDEDDMDADGEVDDMLY